MTSSRKAFLDAIGSSIAVVSSGPTQYGSVFPDQSNRHRAAIPRAGLPHDVDDAACGQNLNKIGPDADGEPGGCTNIRIILKDTVSPQVSVWNGS